MVLKSLDKILALKILEFFLYLQHYALAQLVRSSQECNYKFDNENKHMTSGSCTEKHILIPFSHK